jgi:dihydropyrimidine dehydrogenase (NAD+) subunit PreA
VELASTCLAGFNEHRMPDLSISFAGIASPNPFWLASGPPTNSALQVMRAFDAGWGGAVWKTVGNPIVNVSSRLGSVDVDGHRMIGLNNIELISERTVAENLKEVAEVKTEAIRRVHDTGCDGLELNFGCPHGMCERGMGSAVGQEPKVLEELVRWVMAEARIPVIAKLTPNVSHIADPALAAVRGGANALSLVNTFQSIIGVDLDRLVPIPRVGDASSHGGYCGPAIKPIALKMVAELARDRRIGIPISGIGGIGTWREAAEFLALGAGSVQVCTAVMHHGYRIVEDMIDGLDAYLANRGMKKVGELVGAALPAFKDWGDLDLNYHVVAKIDEAKCIGCNLCFVACHDGAHQCIHRPGTPAIAGHVAPMARIAAEKAERAAPDAPYRVPWVDETECVGCNLCALVCPVHDCITMVERRRASETESWNDRVAAGRDRVPGGLNDR